MGASAFAADAPAVSAKDDRVKEALAKDAVCTKCHDENDNKPILSYYQTRHGVKADPRTPGCQTCHGASDAHVKNPQGVTPRPQPDTVFGIGPKRVSLRRRPDGYLSHLSQVGQPHLLVRQRPSISRPRLQQLPLSPRRRATRC